MADGRFFQRWRAGVVAVAALIAAGVGATPARAYCEDAGSSMVELKNCLAEVEAQVEIELAMVWADVQRGIGGRDFLDAATLARFVAAADRAQAAWRAFRDADCREATGFEWWGGSGAGAAIRSCFIETTAARVRDLTRRYDLDPAGSPISHGDG